MELLHHPYRTTFSGPPIDDMEEASTPCELLQRHSHSPARSSTLRPASNRPQHQADPAEACLLPTPLLKMEMHQQDLTRTTPPQFDARHQLNPPREAPSPQLFHPQPRQFVARLYCILLRFRNSAINFPKSAPKLPCRMQRRVVDACHLVNTMYTTCRAVRTILLQGQGLAWAKVLTPGSRMHPTPTPDPSKHARQSVKKEQPTKAQS
ncbi:hypothetical protein BC567DRAFT_94301 [Phyllosticta citribraziliensis]